MLSLLAMPIHPLVGVETGVVGLAVVGLCGLGEGFFKITPWVDSMKLVARTALTALILVAVTLALWSGQGASALSTSEFIDIVARFRHPHHYLPSTWGILPWCQAACFLVAVGISWRWWQRSPGGKRLPWRVLLTMALVVTLWLGGFVFVEWWPTRAWTTAQVFRLTFLVNWFGMLTIAGGVARVWTQVGWRGPVRIFPPLVAGDEAFSFAAFLSKTCECWRNIAKGWLGSVRVTILTAMLFAVSLGAVARYQDARHVAVVIVLLAILAVLVVTPRPRARIALSVAGIAVLFGLVVADRYVPVLPRAVAPRFTLADSCGPLDAVALFAKQSTPRGAVFLTPPDFGRFRLVAERAIVVDFKVFPFGDNAMREWRQRITDCYGTVSASGLDAVGGLDSNYSKTSIERLLGDARKYGAGYMVLHTGSTTALPILYQDSKFMLVSVD